VQASEARDAQAGLTSADGETSGIGDENGRCIARIERRRVKIARRR